MDCRQALEILEVARPGSSDLSEPELAEAAAHIQSHDDCRNEFARRQQLDRQIGAVIRDVPVPSDLKARLLADLASAAETADDQAVVPGDAVEPTKTPLSRRTWTKVIAGAAACVMAGVIAWQLSPGDPPTVDSNALAGHVATFISDEQLDFSNLTAFAGDFESKLNWEWESSQQKGVTLSGPKAFSLPDHPNSAVAMYQFRFTHRRRPVTGYLLVLPANIVSKPPEATSLAGGQLSYLNRMLASRSWTEEVDGGKFVYVCIMPGGDDHFRTLVSRLSPPNA